MEGTSDKYFCHEATEFVRYDKTPDKLLANLKYERDNVCENSSSVSDKELNKIIKWAWGKAAKDFFIKYFKIFRIPTLEVKYFRAFRLILEL